MNLNERLKSIQYTRLLLGILIGALGGYAYYFYIGCASGTCSITSSPVNSTLYGILIGITFSYKEKKKKA